MVIRSSHSLLLCGAALAVAACEVEPTAPETTGGVDAASDGDCPAGVAVVLSDFASTQVALSGLDGVTRSEAFISSASTQASEVSLALSGDVVLPSARPESRRLVLIDRFGTNVISWVEPRTAEVTAQLPVGTGFESNPQDYVEVRPGVAYVSRWGENLAAGAEPFDDGSDVLVIDTQGPGIIARIAMPRTGVPPRPAGMVRVGNEVIVVQQRLALDFSTAESSALVALDTMTDEVMWELELTGLKGCGTPALSPTTTMIAVACSGQLGDDGGVVSLAETGIVLLDAAESPPRELRRFEAGALATEPVQSEIEFVDDERLLFKTQTPLGGATNNRLLVVRLEDGAVTELMEARPGADALGQGVVYGGLFCAGGCSDLCLMADADRGVLGRWRVTDDALVALDPVVVERAVGLPPRSLGAF